MQTWTKHASQSIFISNDRKHFSVQSVWEINGCHLISYTAKEEIFNLKPRVVISLFFLPIFLPPGSSTVTSQQNMIAKLEQNKIVSINHVQVHSRQNVKDYWEISMVKWSLFLATSLDRKHIYGVNKIYLQYDLYSLSISYYFIMSYWRSRGGPRGAVMSCVTETLRVRQTGSAAKPTSLTWPTVLHRITTGLIRVIALINETV